MREMARTEATADLGIRGRPVALPGPFHPLPHTLLQRLQGAGKEGQRSRGNLERNRRGHSSRGCRHIMKHQDGSRAATGKDSTG